MRVWYNSNFSSIHRVLALIRQADTAKQFTLLCSHRKPDFLGFVTADEHFLEPLEGEAYVDWCLATAKEQQVDVLIPFRAAARIAERRAEFEAQGTRLLEVASPEVLNALHNKIACHQSLAAHPDWLSLHRTFEGAEGFAATHAAMREQLPGALLCVKPSVGVYGKGFYVLDEGLPLPTAMPSATPGELAARYAQDASPQLFMEFLPGPEFSVDAIADHGTPIRHVIRQKAPHRRWQNLIAHEGISTMVDGLVRHFGLNGLFNVQLRTAADGTVKLLEINPRPSGGTGMSCLSGINLPYWALRGFVEGYAGLPIPEVRIGVRVTEISMAAEFPGD